MYRIGSSWILSMNGQVMKGFNDQKAVRDTPDSFSIL